MVSGRRGLRSAAVARAAAGLLGAVVAVAAAGCAEDGAAAGGESGPERLATVRQAADRLTAAGTSRTRTTLHTTSGGTRVTINGTGRFDYAARRGRLTVTPPDVGPGETEQITELITPGELHMRNRGAGVPEGKWVRVDITTLADGNLLANGATDPLRAAELLRGAVEVTYEGRARSGGTALRHYSGTGELGAAARAAGRTPHGSARQLAAAAEGFQQDAFGFDAWFDAEGRLRKVRHDFRSVSVTSITTLYDFGVPVAVAMPDPADIYTGRIAAP
jgi:hypothetical protein